MDKQSVLKDRWWETCSCISRVFSQRDKIPLKETIKRLGEYKEQGIGCIEIFAPYYGGNQYGALDPINYYIVDPAIGVMADFLELVDKCHKMDMAVIIFINVGYAAMNYGDFIKACDDVRRGIDSRETRLFLWADTENAANDGSLSSRFGKKSEGYWQYSEQAGKYYWVKWKGFKGDVALPQFNFASDEWRAECKKAVRFWMDTGIDGVIIDAPYSYANCDFKTHNECITDIIREYPNQYIQPEGGGAAGEELTAWIEKASYNSLQDYSILQGWFKTSLIEEVIKTGDAAPLEKAFQSWRDRVVEAGGTTYLGLIWSNELTPEQRLLEIATIVATGAILHDDNKLMYTDFPAVIRKKIAEILNLCGAEPALRLNGKRETILCEDGVYAFKRYNDDKDAVIVALNFSDIKRTVKLRLPNNEFAGLLSSVGRSRENGEPNELRVVLNGYGYAIYNNSGLMLQS